MQYDHRQQSLVGAAGSLAVSADDEITRKLAMLIEGECEGLGPLQAAQKFGFSKQRYFQIRKAFQDSGAAALLIGRRGPKTFPGDGTSKNSSTPNRRWDGNAPARRTSTFATGR
jgi:hypothetical protein